MSLRLFACKFDGLVKSPSAALRCNFVAAEGRGGSPSRPRSGNPAGCPYHRFCAPGPAKRGRAFYETIVPVTFYKIIIFFHKHPPPLTPYLEMG
ncbi:MAG: hypothetical protein NTY64_20615 [Deltaproteobacteria bacterium]|nr:hypothetical protein [Deltaproteobacteria bacterium]